MAACKSCEAPITWARTESGKAMPLDEKPVAGGTFVYVGGVARRATPDDDQLHRERYTSHFATCPDAAAHRKARP